MKYYATIPDYCRAFGHPPPVFDFFDTRTFEENQQEGNHSPELRIETEPFRVEFYAIGLLLAVLWVTLFTTAFK